MENKILKKITYLNNTEGASMLPVIQPNDGIFIKHVPFNKIEVNDVIIFQKSGRLITHRVIYKRDDYVIAKGDNNTHADGRILSKNILGKVEKLSRNGEEIELERLYLLQSTVYFNEIIKVKRQLSRNGVDHVFIKGLPLHLYFSKSHPRRIYTDCDILIRKSQLKKAISAIEKLGYQKTRETKNVENNYWKKVNAIMVVFDIHLEPAFLMTQFTGLGALYPQKYIDRLGKEMLETKVEVDVNGENYPILNRQLLILYLALHIFHHNFKESFRYHFLDKVIRQTRNKSKSRLLFDLITKKVHEYRFENFVYPVFWFLKKYYDTPIPTNFMKNIRPRKLLTDLYKINIFDEEGRLEGGIGRFINIFTLSPYPLWRKLFVFLNPWVIYYAAWSTWKKLSYFLSNRK